MDGSPRVLSVSFGDFSVRLEGFEDPVATLIAVAEYFRELAERDPGFARGAAVPDAAAIAREAEAPTPGGGEPPREETAPVMPEGGPGPEPTGAVSRDPGVDDPEDGDGWPADEEDPDEAGEGRAGPADGGAWTQGGFTARVLGRGTGAGASEGRRVLGARAGGSEGSLPPARGAGSAEGASAGGRRRLPASPGEDEEALERFLSQAERELSDPDGARRREALAHLRAAVAATEAQRALGEPAPGGESAFREEWTSVARPLDGRGTPQPLRLVASQRVDGSTPRRAAAAEASEVERENRARAAPASGGATRPRAEAREAGPVSFAAFAAQAGAAANLPDLLEAAAAWAAVVRREEEVSRSELLRLASEAMPEPPSREDALRVFGILLRTGRLARVGGGRFRVGENTRFGPARQAG